MKVSIANTGVSVRMTDEQAQQLIQRLQGMVARRAEMIEAVPDLKNWNDHVMTFAAENDGLADQIHFSICAV